MANYWQFSTPRPHAAYLLKFFQKLTFTRSCELSYPKIAPPKSIVAWDFSDDVPSNASGTVILHHDIIPDATDLLPITQLMEDEYQLGRRSVVLKFCILESGEIIEHQCHFAKIRLFVIVNNHRKAVDYSQRLFNHLQTSPAFSTSLVERFGELMITAQISGFAIAHYPLWTLGCLLDENWLEEDVLNSMLELQYFRHAARSTDHSPIFLPTSFFTDAKRLFMRSPQQYSLNIIAL
ncbi:hypothetical protein BDZ94DRAFT_1336366 [Collybia nuda]|uniref:Uncharacterized protein n=1 Tax=Collybia nuda TaxID=64659 RepID=A0A9P6CEG5_9AGAR|nr:hypothetical protein BDZ94DRAFT_1336366 [Collybia nuda]